MGGYCGRALIGGGLILAVTIAEVAQFWFHQGWFFPVWAVGSAVGFWLLANGLNALRQGLGSRTVAAVLALGVLLFLAGPFVAVVVLGSVMERSELLANTPSLIPRTFTLDWYVELWQTAAFPTAVRDSLLVASTSAVFTTLFGVLGAYAIARLRFPGRTAIYRAIMLSYMLPGIVLIIPLVFLYRWWGNTLGQAVVDTLPGMFVAHSAVFLPFIVWLLIGTYEAIEPELEHAARVDGADRFRALWSVVLPTTLPSIATVLVFAFVLSWNEFLVSKVLYISQTPMLGPAIVNLMDPINRVEPKLSAAGVVGSAPVLVLAFLMQRYIVREIASGSVR
jgi:multiple sugar transport system permease protein